MSKATDKAAINAGLTAGLSALTGTPLGGKLPGLDFTTTTTVTSRLDQAGATDSFNYYGPAITLPAVDQSAPFWAARGADAPFWGNPAAVVGDSPRAAAALPGWAIALGLVAVAGLAYYVGRR